MFNENDSITYKKILFPLFFGLAGAMLLYTLSGTIKVVPLIAIFLVISVSAFLYSLWNIWQLVDCEYRSKIYGYIALFAVVFHGTTIAVNAYFQGIIAIIYGYVLMTLFWNLLTNDEKENVLN